MHTPYKNYNKKGYRKVLVRITVDVTKLHRGPEVWETFFNTTPNKHQVTDGSI